ncbi:Abil3 [Thalictrum thalictroides]|uniref:Abil3 n=1 Tax=Thalictrum thalictroides TaxID=46969 RepID=A0A7J6VPB0_THATH|nr:Abil3 [Thalictrum thalictroides]
MSSTSSKSMDQPRKPSNYNVLSMQQSLLFADSLKDLKNLRTQLYSAAEYFELSYTNDDQKRLVVDTLGDYSIKALINTVDHLGSVTYKVNGILDQSVNKVSGLELQVSCMEQRLRTCQKYINSQVHSQQSLMLKFPKYHKRYLLPAGETLPVSGHTVLKKHQWCSLDDGDDWHQFKSAVRSSIRDSPSSAIRKGRSPSPSPRHFVRHGTTFSFTEKETTSEKRGVSPLRSKFPLIRSGSHSRPTTPVSTRWMTPTVSGRPTTPSSTNTRRWYPSEPKKSSSMRLHAEKDSAKENEQYPKDSAKEIEQYPTKSKRLLKALLSRRKSRKDESLYTFLDEY